MKKFFKLSLAVAITFGIVSCGGGSSKGDGSEQSDDKVLTVTPETAVKGALSEYFTVVDRSYKLKKDGMSYELTIEVERNNTPSDFDNDIVYFEDGDESTASMVGGFGYEILDEDGDIIASGAPQTSAYGHDGMTTALRTPMGQTGSIKFHIYDLDGKPSKIRITSDLQENEKKEKASSDKKTSEDESLDNVLEEMKSDMSDELEASKTALKAGKAALNLLDALTD